MKCKLMLAAVIVIIIAAMPLYDVLASGSQTWYLSSVEYTGTPANDGVSHTCDYFMTKTDPNWSLPVEWKGKIGPRELTSWWYSDEAAMQDVVFGEDNWRVNLFYLNTFGQGKINAAIYAVSPSGDITLLASGSSEINSSQLQSMTIICYDNLSTDQIVYQDSRLGLKLEYISGSPYFKGIIIFYNSKDAPASVVSPPSDPGFPIPEFTTAILLGSGLVGLAGYLVASRLKKRCY